MPRKFLHESLSHVPRATRLFSGVFLICHRSAGLSGRLAASIHRSTMDPPPASAELTPISQLPPPEKIIGEGWTILYSLGSYAPAHRNHMELLVLARQFCEQRGLRVAAIVIAPTADHTLRDKLGYLPLPLEARYQCLRLLIADTPGFAGIPVLIDRFLAEGKAKGAGAASAHFEAEVKERYHGHVYVRPVFGLDALTKIRSRHAIENGIIVLNRSSSEVGDNPDEFIARHPHASIIRYIASPTWKVWGDLVVVLLLSCSQ